MAAESYYKYRTSNIALTPTFSQVLGINSQRIGLVFSNPQSAATITARPGQDGPGEFRFFVPQNGTIEFYYSRHGALPSTDWWALSSVPGPVLYICEILLLPGARLDVSPSR